MNTWNLYHHQGWRSKKEEVEVMRTQKAGGGSWGAGAQKPRLWKAAAGVSEGSRVRNSGKLAPTAGAGMKQPPPRELRGGRKEPVFLPSPAIRHPLHLGKMECAERQLVKEKRGFLESLSQPHHAEYRGVGLGLRDKSFISNTHCIFHDHVSWNNFIHSWHARSYKCFDYLRSHF